MIDESIHDIRKKLGITPLKKSATNKSTPDKQLWSPQWNCYCCQDSGVIISSLSKILIDDYDDFHDRALQCNRTFNCSQSCPSGWDDLNCDRSISKEICQKLHDYNREIWEHWKKEDQKKHLHRQKLIQHGFAIIGNSLSKSPDY